jgi:hypothetical protein
MREKKNDLGNLCEHLVRLHCCNELVSNSPKPMVNVMTNTFLEEVQERLEMLPPAELGNPVHAAELQRVLARQLGRTTVMIKTFPNDGLHSEPFVVVVSHPDVFKDIQFQTRHLRGEVVAHNMRMVIWDPWSERSLFDTREMQGYYGPVFIEHTVLEEYGIAMLTRVNQRTKRKNHKMEKCG